MVQICVGGKNAQKKTLNRVTTAQKVYDVLGVKIDICLHRINFGLCLGSVVGKTAVKYGIVFLKSDSSLL